jgi:hypothetical protein
MKKRRCLKKKRHYLPRSSGGEEYKSRKKERMGNELEKGVIRLVFVCGDTHRKCQDRNLQFETSDAVVAHPKVKWPIFQ